MRGVGRRELKELPRLSLCGGITEWANLQTNMGFETSNKRRFFFGQELFTCNVYYCLSVRNQTKAGLEEKKKTKDVGKCSQLLISAPLHRGPHWPSLLGMAVKLS